MKRRFLIFFLSTTVYLNTSFAQKASHTPSADDILLKAVAGFLPVRDFSATVLVEIQMERVQIPRMKAVMYFKKPDKVHFSSESFLLLPREGLALNPSILQEQYRPQSFMQDTLDAKKVFKLYLKAKESKTHLRELNIWIDPLTWTIIKVETIPYEGRILSMVFTYQHVEEKYWLPSKLVVQYKSESSQVSMDSSHASDQPSDVPQRVVPRNGTMTIVYSAYTINTGIPDDLFEKKEKK